MGSCPFRPSGQGWPSAQSWRHPPMTPPWFFRLPGFLSFLLVTELLASAQETGSGTYMKSGLIRVPGLWASSAVERAWDLYPLGSQASIRTAVCSVNARVWDCDLVEHRGLSDLMAHWCSVDVALMCLRGKGL